MRRIVTFSALGLAALAAAPATARDDAWYIGVKGGAMLVEDIDWDIGDDLDNIQTIDHRTGYDVGGTVGYDLGAVRLEAEVGYRSAAVTGLTSGLPIPSYTPSGAISGDHPPGNYDYAGGRESALAFMVNALWDFGDDDGVQGFVGPGLGVARVKTRVGLDPGGDYLDDRDTVVAWQAIAGVRAPITDSIDISLKYRFFVAPGLEFEDAVGRRYYGQFRSHSLIGGLTFNFGGTGSGPADKFEDFSRRQRDKEQAENRRHIELHGGYGRIQLPRTNYGFVSNGPIPAPEYPAARSESLFGGVTVGGLVRLYESGTFGFEYAEGKESNRTEVAASTTGGRRGYPYTATSPSGSTGIGGNIALAVETEAAVKAFGGVWRHRFGYPAPRNPSAPTIAPTISIGGAYRNRDHLGIVSITTPVIATQRLEQGVKEFELGLAVGVDALVPLSPGVRLELAAEAGPYFYDFDLKSLETNSQNFGPAADRAFSKSLTDSISGIGFRTGASIALSVAAGERLDLTARAEADYSSARAQVRNPVNGTAVQNGSSADLYFAEALNLRFLLGARFRF